MGIPTRQGAAARMPPALLQDPLGDNAFVCRPQEGTRWKSGTAPQRCGETTAIQTHWPPPWAAGKRWPLGTGTTSLASRPAP